MKIPTFLVQNNCQKCQIKEYVEIYFIAFSPGFIWEETAFPGLILIGLHFLALFWKDLPCFPVLFWKDCVSCGGWYFFFIQIQSFYFVKNKKNPKKVSAATGNALTSNKMKDFSPQTETGPTSGFYFESWWYVNKKK